MGLTHAQMDRMIDEHFGYESRDDIDGVLRTLAPGAIHDVVGWPTGPTTDREMMRSFYTQLFKDLSEGKAETVRRLYGEKFVVDESFWRGRAPGRPFGVEGKNKPVSFRVLHVVEFAENGQISRENVWLDMAAILMQLKEG